MGAPAFLDRLSRSVLLGDGGMGTMLYAKGVYINTCFDELNVSAPDLVREVHAEYARSGADVIETNTFGANRVKLRRFGLEDRTAALNRAGAALAREAAGPEALIAGAIGPLGVAVGPRGAAVAAEAFAEQAEALAGGGVDLFVLETFSDLNEIRLALGAVRAAGKGLPVVAQMTIGEDGATRYGTAPEDFARRLEEWGADVVGVNCSVGPAPMLECIERMASATAVPLSAMPNAGLPRDVDGRNIYLCSPDYMAEYAKRFILAGVKLVGGCCGTTPAHIRAMRGAVRALRGPGPSRIAVLPAVPERLRLEPPPIRERSGLGRRLADREFIVSVEIVPPRGPDAAAAVAAARTLAGRGIPCVNIPDGPRASARMSPMALASILARETPVEPILHYTCRDRNLLGMQSDLLGIFAQGTRNLLLVTGDPPKMGDCPSATAVFDLDSIGLTAVVGALNRGIDIGGRPIQGPTGFLVGVGANPGAADLGRELARLEAKFQAGAEFVITQPVFDVRKLEEFLFAAAAWPIPIIAGLWPLSSLRNAEFMNNEVPGASVPDAIMERMRAAQNRGPEEARAEGVRIARETLSAILPLVRGIQISPPAGRYDLVLQVLEGLGTP